MIINSFPANNINVGEGGALGARALPRVRTKNKGLI